jgi:hypothetical protein
MAEIIAALGCVDKALISMDQSLYQHCTTITHVPADSMHSNTEHVSN